MEPQEKCPECKSFNLQITTEKFGKYSWHEYICLNCRYHWSNEPEFESMKGGPDHDI